MSHDAFDEGVKGWHVDHRDGKSVKGFIPNRGPLWWRHAVLTMHAGATVVQERHVRQATARTSGDNAH